MKTPGSLLVVLTLLSSVGLSAQAIRQIEPQADPRAEKIAQLSSIGKGDAEYRLGPGDLIEIAVFGVDKLRQSVRITASGLIKFPLLEPIMASGLTPAELEQRLAEALAGDVVRNPQVAVFVREYKSQPVFVLGAVKSPGQYTITQQLRLIDVISMAGGLLPSAVDTAVVQRPAGNTTAENGAPDDDIIKIDLEQLLGKGDLTLNIPVRGGDVVHIAERKSEVFYVIGEVNRAGAFQIPPKQDIRVSQAFASAGGPMKTARMSKAILVRFDEKGQRQELPVDFADILKGKKADIQVRADDVIFVPGSNFKNIGYGLMAGAPGSIINLPYALSYYLR